MKITRNPTGFDVDGEFDLTLKKRGSYAFDFIDNDPEHKNTLVMFVTRFNVWACYGGIRQKLRTTWAALKFIWGRE